MKWHKTADKLPTNVLHKQVKILMMSPEWACPIYGMYMQNEYSDWSEYDQINDQYLDLEKVPEYWAKVTFDI